MSTCATTPPDALEVLIQRVLDSTTGILKFVSTSDLQADEPPLFVGIAEMIDARKIEPTRMPSHVWQEKAKRTAEDSNEHLKVPSGTIHSSGAGLDRTKALWATVGEALERYAMGYYHPSDSVFCTAEELGVEAVDVSSLILFEDAQYEQDNFPYQRYDAALPRHWVPGVSLHTAETRYLPAELCIGTELEGNPGRLDGTFSTGCAAGPDYQKAVLSGLSEAVERDAFMYYWLTGFCPPQLSVERLMPYLPPKLAELANYPHVDVYLRWLKTDIDIPTVACFVKPKFADGFATGAATNVDWRVAVEKAMVESFHTLNWTVDLDRWRDGPQDAADIRDFPQHVSFYLDEANHGNVDFLVDEAAPDGTEEFLSLYGHSVKSLPGVLQQIAGRGYEAIAVDRTYDDLDSLGLKVVHVVIPGLQPLHVGLGCEHLDRRRLDRLSEHFGVTPPDTLNLNPHPFP